MPNRLAGEKSPYLLQHAHNPVDWYPWGEEAFARARAYEKPIFLSVGYSTCHWCHVMERESFENERIAALLNRDYVAIKVDREERPDVDRIYMTFVQATAGSGGWPMSVWLTPELEPFFGGTYFPPENRYGHSGFASILGQIAEAWRNHRAQIVESARDVVEQLRKHSEVAAPAHPAAIGEALLDGGFQVFRRTFDSHTGGFGGAPKFPRPSVLYFLMRFYARTGNREALDAALLTLREMAKGGMNDQLGGGFHRYSVDERWFVPHFEKMLYDQGQLATAYLEAFQITRDPGYAATARRIFDYVLRDMTDRDGAFFSAEDADSVIDPGDPAVKGEGAFYVWSADEIRAVAPGPASVWFCHRYGVADGGNVASDPHQEFTGRNILYQAATIEETAEQFGRAEDEVRAAIEDASRLLLEARGRRVRPHLDDKILTSWNGLMISALALGGAVLGEPLYAKAARRAAEFLAARMWNPDGETLLRRYRQGDAAIPAFLDDYALLAQALLDLYETQFDFRHLELAIRLMERAIELFGDASGGGFFNSGASDASLVIRLKEDYDGAEPSGNSVAVLNLLRLERITGRSDFRAAAEAALAAFAPRLSLVPAALPYLLAAAEFAHGRPREIVIAGAPESAATRALIDELYRHFVPNRVVLLAADESVRRRLAAWNPAIASMASEPGAARAYVCRNFACELPVSEPAEFAKLIQLPF
ncbi:MAG: thioredoxin domain-containing protein [Bryobacteraceae bacterium]